MAAQPVNKPTLGAEKTSLHTVLGTRASLSQTSSVFCPMATLLNKTGYNFLLSWPLKFSNAETYDAAYPIFGSALRLQGLFPNPVGCFSAPAHIPVRVS